MNAKKFADWFKKILMPGRSLLFPMILLASGLHVALLLFPIPSSEAIKEAEDQKNPITVNQIPTEQPTPRSTAARPASVNVPALPAPPAVTNSDSGADSPASEVSTSDTSAANSPAPITPPAPKPTKRSPSGVSATSTPPVTSSESTAETPATPESANPVEVATTSEPTPSEPTSNTTNPFAEFPHFQPSEADCFGLGFGENCRVVNKGAIAQVTDFFKQELAAKAFTANLVTDEPTRKVFRVTRGDKTLFLNIWQGQDQVSYLLSRVVVKQSPAEIKTEGGK